MSRDGFIFYKSFKEALEELDDTTYRQVVDAIATYAIDGVVPETKGVVSAMFKLMKPQIDANNKKYENGKKGAEHGNKGGRPPKETPEQETKTPEKPLENHTETPREPQENPNETPKVKDKVKDKAKGKDNAKEKDSLLPNPTSSITSNIRTHVQVIEAFGQEPQKANPYAPQLIDVQEFCAGKGLLVDAEEFYRRYAATGWFTGGQQIKDWKSLAMAWDAGERKRRRQRQQTNRQTSLTGSKFMDIFAEEDRLNGQS